jgi:Domain of unknown function (DUF4405)
VTTRSRPAGQTGGQSLILSPAPLWTPPRTTRRLVTRRGRDRVIWLVNLALLAAMTLCVASGIVISRVAMPTLGILTVSTPFWNRLHILTAEITLGLVPVHAALRWRWIVSVARHLVTRGPGRRSR